LSFFLGFFLSLLERDSFCTRLQPLSFLFTVHQLVSVFPALWWLVLPLRFFEFIALRRS
jgi:hypothetical protein